MKSLKPVNFGGWKTLVDKSKGYAPYFSSMQRQRVHQKRATNITVVGEPGISKSHMGISIARVLDPKFCLDQVVFFYKEFLDLVLELPTGKPIVFDEPSYAMSHRDWYQDLNKALVKTVESFRSKVHPLIIPVINKSLLDKTIRDHLIQFQVVVHDRGRATVYRIKPSQFTEKVYFNYLCNLEYGLFDRDLCDRDSCLDCPQLPSCTIFRARYERKKAAIQDKRYEEARDLAEESETRRLTMKQIEGLSLTIKDLWLTEKGVDVQGLRVALRDQYRVHIGNNKGYELKAMLEMHHPELLSPTEK